MDALSLLQCDIWCFLKISPSLLGQEDGYFTAGLIFVLKPLWEFGDNLFPLFAFFHSSSRVLWVKMYYCCLFDFKFAPTADLFICLPICLLWRQQLGLVCFLCSKDGGGVANKPARRLLVCFQEYGLLFCLWCTRSAFLYFKLKICWVIGKLKVCSNTGWKDGAELTKLFTYFFKWTWLGHFNQNNKMNADALLWWSSWLLESHVHLKWTDIWIKWSSVWSKRC